MVNNTKRCKRNQEGDTQLGRLSFDVCDFVKFLTVVFEGLSYGRRITVMVEEWTF